jgi:EAL domain-containing protein (putative c-di-GMP-specific phosphodiesterase class I)
MVDNEIRRKNCVRFTMAFQPVVDVGAGGLIFAYEALVRGQQGESADKIFAQIPRRDAVAFDAACRRQAIRSALDLGITHRLSLNVSAKAICHHRYGLAATLSSARQLGFPVNNLIFEMTENDPVVDIGKVSRGVTAAREHNVKFAIDDFGAGYASLNTMLFLRPEIIKLDVLLVRDIDREPTRQILVKGIVDACQSFGCTVIAEGVETIAEFSELSMLGITLMQGYLFAKPGIASLPVVAERIGFSHTLPNPIDLGSTSINY